MTQKKAEDAIGFWCDGNAYDIRFAQQNDFESEDAKFIEDLIYQSKIHYDTEEQGVLYRGIAVEENEEIVNQMENIINALNMRDDDFEYAMELFESERYIDMCGTSSWTNMTNIANAFGQADEWRDADKRSIIFELSGLHANDRMAIDISAEELSGTWEQGEVILSKNALLAIDNVKKTDNGIYYVYMHYFGNGVDL